ncbi:MAG: class I SAM-dependent methyltransferase [Thermodesulfobacteriota bacterium]
MLSELLKGFLPVDVSRMRAGDFLGRQNEIENVKLRAIEKGGGWKDVRSCPLCGCARREAEFPKHGVDLVGCLECGLRYGARIPSNLDDVYKSPEYVSFSKEDTDDHFNYRRDRFGRERVGILAKYCGDLTDLKILDIGCGNGYFLAAAKESCRRCFGTESSGRLREFAARKTGLPVFGEELERLPEKDFDIVTLFDVIEHVPAPVPFMESVLRLMKSGGRVLVFTPNFDSFSIRVMQARSSIVDPTEHVVLFTRQSLQYLADALRLEIIYHETQGLDVQNILSMEHVAGTDAGKFLARWANELQAMINRSSCGDYSRIMYRKA